MQIGRMARLGNLEPERAGPAGDHAIAYLALQ
jgi:hypothetical protein